MRTRPALVLSASALALLVLHAPANADDPAPPTPAPAPQQASGHVRVAPVLPTLRITGSTNGKAEVQVGLDLVLGITNGWDLALTPTFRATSDAGITDLFSLTSELSKPWQLGLTVSFIQLGVSGSDAPGGGGALDTLKQHAWDLCSPACASGGSSEDEKRFCEKARGRSALDLDNKDFCDKGRAILRQSVLVREWKGRFPHLVLAVGALVGAKDYTFQAPVPNTQTIPPTLASQTETHVDWTLGTSVTYVARDSGFTFEAPLLYSSTWAPSANLVSACIDVGQFTPTANITSVGRASFCSGDPYGGPQQTQRVFLTAQAGYVSKPSGFWRASGGPVFSWQTTRFQELMTAPGTNSNAPTIGAVDQSSYTIGLETPVYLNFASGPEKYVGDYKGLLRVTPSALFTHFDSGGWDKALFVKVELLGQRTMFAKVLDW